MAGAPEARVGGQERLGSGLRLLQKPHVSRQIRNVELGQTVLPGAEEVARAADSQVLLGDLKAVCGVREDLKLSSLRVDVTITQ